MALLLKVYYNHMKLVENTCIFFLKKVKANENDFANFHEPIKDPKLLN